MSFQYSSQTKRNGSRIHTWDASCFHCQIHKCTMGTLSRTCASWHSQPSSQCWRWIGGVDTLTLIFQMKNLRLEDDLPKITSLKRGRGSTRSY